VALTEGIDHGAARMQASDLLAMLRP